MKNNGSRCFILHRTLHHLYEVSFRSVLPVWNFRASIVRLVDLGVQFLQRGDIVLKAQV